MDQHPLLLANESIHDSGIIEDVHQESECDTGNEEYGDESNLESNLRRRKGKIISCVENGELFYCGESGFYFFSCGFWYATKYRGARCPFAGDLSIAFVFWYN